MKYIHRLSLSILILNFFIVPFYGCNQKEEDSGKSSITPNCKSEHQIEYFTSDSTKNIYFSNTVNLNNFNTYNLFKNISDSTISTVTKNCDSLLIFRITPDHHFYSLDTVITGFKENKIVNYTIHNDNLYFLVKGKKHTQLLKRNINTNESYVIVSDTSFINTNAFIGNDFHFKNNAVFLSYFSLNRQDTSSFVYRCFDTNRKKNIGKLVKRKNSNLLHPLADSPGMLLKGDTIVIFYGYLHYVELYNATTLKKITDKCLKSNFTREVIPGLVSDQAQDFQVTENHIIETEYYLKLVWHPNLHKFIRIVKHKQPLKDENKLLNNRYWGPWSLIIANENFEIEKEIVLPQKTFHFFSCILTSEGIAFPFINQPSVSNITFNEIKL